MLQLFCRSLRVYPFYRWALSGLFLSTLLSTAAFGLHIERETLIGGFLTTGTFKNGNSFTYRSNIDGDQGTLTFQKGGRKKNLKTVPVRYMFPAESRDRAALYLDLNDRLLALTDKGLLVTVLPEITNFFKNHWVIRADVFYKGEAYAIVSGMYLDSLEYFRNQDGETYVVRLSDGKTALVDRRFRGKTQLKKVVLNGDKLQFSHRVAISLSHFDQEALTRQEKFPTRTIEIPKDAAASTEPDRFYEFETGARLKFVFDSGSVEPGVYYQASNTKKDEWQILVKGKPTSYPLRKNAQGDQVYGIPWDQKLVPIFTQEGAWVVLESGKTIPLLADYANKDPDTAVSSNVFLYKGQQHLLVSVPYRSELHEIDLGEEDGTVTLEEPKGETYIVREDGVSGMIGYETDPSMKYSIKDGILELTGVTRKIDLDALPEEMQFHPQPMQPLLDAEGDEVNPIEMVSQFYEDITEKMRRRNTAFPPLDQEALQQLIVSLSKRKVGMVILLGEPGIGKSHLVDSYANELIAGRLKNVPRTIRILGFDALSVGQGTQYTGAFETKVKAALEVAKMMPTELFIDEIHSMRGQGTSKGNDNDAFQHLKRALAYGEVKVIGTTTRPEYEKNFLGDGALSRRTDLIDMDEPAKEKVFEANKNFMRQQGFPPPGDDVFEFVYWLSSSHSAVGAQPSNAERLWEEVYARMRREEGQYRIPTAADIEKAATRLYKLRPVFYKKELMDKMLLDLPRLLDEAVVGYSELKDALAELTQKRFEARVEQKKPAMRLLVAGSLDTNVLGLMQAYAKAMGLGFQHFRGNDFANDLGAVKFKQRLGNVLRKDAFSVIYFDGLEDAHESVRNEYSQILMNGDFYINERLATTDDKNSSLVRVKAYYASFIANTKLGSKGSSSMGFGQASVAEAQGNVDSHDIEAKFKRRAALKRSMVKEGFSETSLDRFQIVALATPLTQKQTSEVIRRQLDEALGRATQHGIKVTILPQDVEALLAFISGRYFETGELSRTDKLFLVQELLDAAIKRVVTSKPRQPGDQVVLKFQPAGQATSQPSACQVALSGIPLVEAGS